MPWVWVIVIRPERLGLGVGRGKREMRRESGRGGWDGVRVKVEMWLFGSVLRFICGWFIFIWGYRGK